MKYLRTTLGTALVALMLVACAGTSAPSKREMILGSWEGDFQGQSIVLTYSENEVSVESFGITFPYEWVDDDHVRLDAMGQVVVSTVEFEGPDKMVQRSDQGIQTMTRVK